MKPAAFIGIALVMLGILSFAYRDTTYTDRDKVADCGALFAGFVMFVVNVNKPLTQRQ